MTHKLLTITVFSTLLALAFSPSAEAGKTGAKERFTAYVEFASMASFEAEEKQLSGETTMEYRFERVGSEMQPIDMVVRSADGSVQASCGGNSDCAVQPDLTQGEVTMVPVNFRAAPGTTESVYDVDIIYN